MYSRTHSFSGSSHKNSQGGYSHGQTSGGIHALVRAASRNDLDAAEKELRNGGFTTDDYVSAISRAGGFEHIEMLKLLTRQPFNTMENNERSMRWAARHGKIKSLRYFIEELNVNAGCFNSASLRKAAQYGHLREVMYLHSKGADVNAAHNEAIKSAVRFYHDDVGEFLVKNGADFCLYEDDFDPSIRREVYYQSGTNTGNFEVDRWDLFYRVATKGNSMGATFKAMLDKGVPTLALETASIKVASYGMIDQYKTLRSLGADVNSQNSAALSEAARFGHKAMVNYFLQEEPNIDKTVGIQRAIKKAIEGNQDDVVQVLLHQIQDKAMSFSNIGELLDRFLRFKQMSSAKELVEINPWFINECPDIALKVVRFGSSELLKTCIEFGMQILNTEVNYVDAALERFNFDNARVLIEEGLSPSNVNMCMVNAAQFGKSDIMTYMLELGARSNFNNNEALKKAIEFDHVTSAKILRQYDADVTSDMFELCRSNEMNLVLQMDNETLENEIKVPSNLKLAM